MAANAGPKLVTGSMSFYIDAANKKSLTTISNGWKDLLGNTPNLAFSAATFSAVNGGIVTFAGTRGSSASTTFNLSTDMTWDVWFKRKANVGDATLVPASNYNMVFESGPLPYFSFGWASVSPDRFIFSWFTKFGTAGVVQQTLSPTTFYSNNVWYNVTCTLKFDLAATTSTTNMYVNGVFVGTLTTGVNSVDTVGFQGLNGGVIRLATYNVTGQYPFNGSISNLKIYRRILTATEIQQNYNAMAQRFQPDVAELAVYHIDAANRNSFTSIQNGWTDLSNNRNALSFTGATFDSANGGVIKFDGTPGSSASVAQSFFSTTSKTFDVWLKRDQSVSDFNMIWSYHVPYLAFLPNGELLLSYYSNDGTGNTNGMSQRTLYSGATFNNNVWYNVTCTIDYNLVATTATAKIYVNGSLIITQGWPMTQPLTSFTNNNLYMGNWVFPTVGNTSHFKGSISNFRIYDRVLTDTEILQNYNALKARFGY
jgi:hypothetical protein